MDKSIRILFSVIILIFGYILADCIYGFTFGGEFGWIALLLVFVFGIIFALISIIIIFNKEKRKTAKSKEIFVIILILFIVVCIFGYRPLNHISGANDYIEYRVEVVEIYGTGKGSWLFLDPQYYVTVKDENGEVFEVEDYNLICEYDEGDTVLLREYIGGFNLKYYSILILNE